MEIGHDWGTQVNWKESCMGINYSTGKEENNWCEMDL